MISERTSRWLATLGHLGVIVGFVLLVFELKQTRDLMRAQTRHDLSSSIVTLLLSIAENPELAHVMVRGDAGEELSPDEHYIYMRRGVARSSGTGRMSTTNTAKGSTTRGSSPASGMLGRLISAPQVELPPRGAECDGSSVQSSGRSSTGSCRRLAADARRAI
jgi:hypothetical protein